MSVFRMAYWPDARSMHDVWRSHIFSAFSCGACEPANTLPDSSQFSCAVTLAMLLANLCKNQSLLSFIDTDLHTHIVCCWNTVLCRPHHHGECWRPRLWSHQLPQGRGGQVAQAFGWWATLAASSHHASLHAKCLPV